MSRLDEIKARADVATPGPWHAWDRGIGWEVHKGEECAPGCGRSCDALNGEFRETFTRADAEFIAAAREDVPWLVSEVERLTAERDALAQIKRHIDEVRDGTGWTVQIYGVLLQQCDQYGKTIDTRRAERLTAERDALAAQVARAEKLAGQWERMAATAINPDSREWLQACAATLRECLSGWQKMHAALAAPTETDDLERCDCGRVVPCRHCDPTGQEDSPDAGHRCEPYYSRAECGQCGWQEQWCVTCSRKMCGCATDTMGADQ